MTNVLRLLSRDFVQLVIIAILLALPVAWYLMDQWLAGFAYRIHLQWWVFACARCLGPCLAYVEFTSIEGRPRQSS